MSKRRTISSVRDILDRTVTVGDIVGIAVSESDGGSSAKLRLVSVENIYLDDSKGDPYIDGPTLFRDPATGLLYSAPTDETRPDWGVGSTPVTNYDPSLFVPVNVKRGYVGYGYKGSNEVVSISLPRIAGKPVSGRGEITGKTSTYTINNILLVEGVTIDTLKNN